MKWRITFLAVAALASAVVTGLSETDRTRDTRNRRDAFALYAGPVTMLSVNDVQCPIDNRGLICVVDINGTFFLRWPKGSPNAYLFNSGLQIAGLIEGDAGPWTGDTVGAFFARLDGGGIGWPRDELYNSTNTLDLANWPADAYVTDTELFPPELIGRKAASQQDTWTRYWDGDPISSTPAVKHPMGIEVEQRSMAWNFPTGNETVIYWIMEFKNITNEVEFQELNELFYFGDVDALPDDGWTLDDIHVAFAVDPDIGDAGDDLSTAILPFNLGVAYDAQFSELTFVYPPDIFFPPFFIEGTGMFGIKYLKSPTDPMTGEEVGLTLFSTTQLPFPGSEFSDPRDDDQLYRYLSGRLDPSQGDPECNVRAQIETGNPATTERSVCFVNQSADDTRSFQSSGPFRLAPGEQTTIAVAFIVAPTVERMPDGTPSGVQRVIVGPVPEVNSPGVASFHPGFASDRACDPGGVNCRETLTGAENSVKAIERAAGWVAYSGPAPAGALESPANRLDQFAVDVVPGSLLGRALVAQSTFDNKFLLGFAPEPPPFYLMPGDNEVAIVWEPTPSEAEGDPFGIAAADPQNRLYNPNYRRFDVEGYRVWRGEGTDIRDLELIAQFDYNDTQFVDYTCETVLPEDTAEVARVDPFTGDTIGDLTGYSRNEICPFVDSPRTLPIDQFLVFNNGGEGSAPGAGVSRNPDNTNDVIRLDTVIVSDRLLPIEDKIPLQDNGVPFVYFDQDVQNNFTYFYAVTAFDVNSPTSGSISLRSPKLTQTTVPRANSPELELATFESSITGDDGVPLFRRGLLPTVDRQTGIFTGPSPPTDALVSGFAPLIERLLPQFALTLIVDSVQVRHSGNLASGTQELEPSSTCTPVPDTDSSGEGDHLASPFGACWVMYVTADRDGTESIIELPGYSPWWSAFGEVGNISMAPLTVEVGFDPDALAAFGIPDIAGDATMTVSAGEALNQSASAGPQARRFGALNTGPRWFDGSSAEGAVNTIEDPTKFRRAGHVAAADTIFSVKSHNLTSEGVGDATDNAISFEKQCFNRAVAFLDRGADIVWEWDGDGGFSGVRDVTHNVDVQFKPVVGPSWGFLTTDANGNGVIDWHDFNYIERAIDIVRAVDGGTCNLANATRFDPNGTAASVQLVSTASLVPTSTNGMDIVVDLEAGAPLGQTGVGFGLFVNGHRYIFEMTELPAAGTKWTLRSFRGIVIASNEGSDDPAGYVYRSDVGGTFDDNVLPPLIPGLRLNFSIPEATAPTGPVDLTQIHTVPDPYRNTSAYDRAPTEKQLMFVNLPSRATMRIYSLSGILVRVLEHDDPTEGGRYSYDLRNRNNQFIASGVYFFHVITPEGYEHVGKFTVIIAGE